MATPPSDRYILHSAPRTASSALMRILNVKAQSNITPQEKEGYFVLPYIHYINKRALISRPRSEWSEEEVATLLLKFKECLGEFGDFLNKADTNSHKIYIKEHADFLTDTSFMFKPTTLNQVAEPNTRSLFTLRDLVPKFMQGPQTWSKTNYTIFPDEFLATWKPTFLIRHPAVMFPSQFRNFPNVFDPEVGSGERAWTDLYLTLKWSRAMYELYKDVIFCSEALQKDLTFIWPIVLESAELLSEPDLCRKYCQLIGFDEEKLKLSWEAKRDVKGKSIGGVKVSPMNVTLDLSTGIMKEKIIKDVNIDDEVPKWIEEFGEVDGKRMEKWVRDAMPDYEFLMARRLRV